MSQMLQHINLQLDAHHIALDIEREKEPIYRDAAARLNRRYQHYMRQMPRASVEQIWVYVALEFAVNLESDARDKSLEPVAQRIEAMNQLIVNELNYVNS